jgi:putative colanic acid biosynthesis acetyltransferase WcaF
MPPPNVDLSTYQTSGFDRGAGPLKEALWILASFLLFRHCPLSLSWLKCLVLRLFGASIGSHVVIKPDVRITFPWKLSIGDHVWIGEEAWLLNLAPIRIENHVCVSQRAFLCTGSHDYKAQGFDLIVGPIVVESGAWVCAGAWVGPGVRVGAHSVLAANSVANHDLEAFGVYRGNPSMLVRKRVIAAS